MRKPAKQNQSNPYDYLRQSFENRSKTILLTDDIPDWVVSTKTAKFVKWLHSHLTVSSSLDASKQPSVDQPPPLESLTIKQYLLGAYLRSGSGDPRNPVFQSNFFLTFTVDFKILNKDTVFRGFTSQQRNEKEKKRSKQNTLKNSSTRLSKSSWDGL